MSDKTIQEMRLTKAQRDVLQRMQDGQPLILSEWRIPYRYWFEHEDGTRRTVTRAVAVFLLAKKFIARGIYQSAFTYSMDLTDEGRFALSPPIPELPTFRSNKSIPVTKHFVATRELGVLNPQTQIAYHSPEEGTIVTWITVTTQILDPIRLHNRGTLMPDEAAELSTALLWAAEEARLLAAEVTRRKEITDGIAR